MEGDFRIGDWLAQPRLNTLVREGKPLVLEPKVVELLVFLARHPGEVLRKEQIIKALWEGTFVTDNALTRCIAELRKALNDDAKEPRFIQTISKTGYRLIAPVTWIEAESRSTGRSPSEFAPAAAVGLKANPRRVAAILAFSVSLVAVLIAAGVWRLSPKRTIANFKARDWVLVSKFENRTGEPVLDGTIEFALGQELSNSRFVNVVPRERIEDALRLMRKSMDTPLDPQIAREVCLRDGGIRVFITGRVEKLGSGYKLGTCIMDPQRDLAICTSSEPATDQEDILAAVRIISNWTRELLGEALSTIEQSQEALEKVSTPSLRALQLYTLADGCIRQGKNVMAEQLLKEALVRDSDFASAEILLAWSLSNQGRPQADFLPHAERAVELSKNSTERERFFIAGSYYHMKGERDKAVAQYQALLYVYPEHFWAVNNLAHLLQELGLYGEALQHIMKRAELRPHGVHENASAGQALLDSAKDLPQASRYAARIRQLLSPEVISIYPTEATWALFFPAHEYWMQGNVAEADREVTRLARSVDSTSGFVRHCYAVHAGLFFLTLGELKKAEEMFGFLQPVVDAGGLPWDGGRPWEGALLALAYEDTRAMRKFMEWYLGAPRPYLGVDFPVVLLIRAGRLAEANKAIPRNHQNSGDDWDIARGEMELARGRYSEAISLLNKGLGRGASRPGPAPYLLGTESLARAFEKAGRIKEAIEALEEVSGERIRTYHHGYGPSGWLWLRIRSQLSELYRKAGRNDDARRVEDELMKLFALADADHPIVRRSMR